MKKTLRIMLALALVIASLSVSVSAASNGFYGIGDAVVAGTDTVVETVTVTPMQEAGETDTVISATTDKNVDGVDGNETWYENSDKLAVSYSAATAGKNYGVILVKGDTLPTASSAIYYINQVQADGETVAFDVYPSDFAETEATMTLYISSDDEGAPLVSVPMAYVVGYEEEEEILYGDVNGDGKANNKDKTFIARKILGGYTFDFTFNEEAADVYHDGKVNNKDKTFLQRWILGGYFEPNVLPQYPES